MTTQQLGRGLTTVIKQQVSESLMHADVDAFHAPSECHALVSKGEDERYEEALKKGAQEANMSLKDFKRALAQLPERHHHRAFGNMLPEHY